MAPQKLVLIDAHSLLHRAYHALPSLTTSKGEQVGAVFGFTSMLLKVFNELKPECVAVAFDTPAPTFRHQKYPLYKAQRPEIDEELKEQVGRAKGVVAAFDIPSFEVEGFEADDIIGTLARQSSESKNDLEVVIVTGDLDTLQLVNDRVKVYTTRRGFSDTVVYDVEAVKKRYGLLPSQLVDYKALCGDPSDNIPGVSGIGAKTATELLSRYDTLSNVFKHLDELTGKQRRILSKEHEQALLSQKLIKIERNVPVKLDLKKCMIKKYDRNQVLALFRKLEFRSLLSRLPKRVGEEQVGLFEKPATAPRLRSGQAEAQKKTEAQRERAERQDYQIVDSEEKLDTLINELKDASELAVDTETTNIDPRQAKLVGISLATKPGRAWYTPADKLKVILRRAQDNAEQSRSIKSKKLKVILEDSEIKKIGHNLKYDAQVLRNEGINLTPLSFDTMIAAYLLQEGQGRLNLKELAFSKLGMIIPETTELLGAGKDKVTMDKVPQEKIAQYACLDVDATIRLKERFSEAFSREEKLAKLFFEIEMPLVEVLMEMEKTGVLIDTKFLSSLAFYMQEQIAKKGKEVFKLVGHEFNLKSSQQLEQVLFDELKLPVVKRTKTQRSTDESVLKNLDKLHSVIEPLLKYRKLCKVRSTYVDPLPKLVDKNGRIHTTFNQTKTATGRLSSESPNLQNIPTDKEFNIRRAFIAPEGCKLLSTDYSQIELRIMAHFSKDSNLVSSFKADQDIHRATAARIFDCFINEVTPKQRKIAKIMNFAVMYGMSAHGLSEVLGIEHHKAQKYIDEYFESYPEICSFIEKTLKAAYEKGYVETLMGRKRLIPELSSSRFAVQKAGERMAINHPIQGTAADLIKLAMVKISEKLKVPAVGGASASEKLKTKMILQVHDELLFELPEGEIGEVGKLVKNEMENAIKLSIPIKVDLKVGSNWGEMKTLAD